MATPRYAVSWHIDPPFVRHVPRRALAALVRRALATEGVPAPAAVGVAITDDDAVRELNRRYRRRNAPTDVLSFSLKEEASFVLPAKAPRLLGEVVISYPTAARQAREAGHLVREELAHLLVHGVLHLLGYDHLRAAEAQAMRAREEALLGARPH